METDKNPAAVALGRLGGLAAGRSLTAEQKSAKLRKAVRARWRQYYALNPDKLAAKQERDRKKKRRKAA